MDLCDSWATSGSCFQLRDTPVKLTTSVVSQAHSFPSLNGPLSQSSSKASTLESFPQFLHVD